MSARSWQKVPANGRQTDTRTQVCYTPAPPPDHASLPEPWVCVTPLPLSTFPLHHTDDDGNECACTPAACCDPDDEKTISICLSLSRTHWTHARQAFFGELLEALAVEPGDASGFGFVVSAAKSPGPADMPKLLVKNPADVASAIASGETLLDVDGFKTSGMTARDVKEIVSRASMRVRLTVQCLHGDPKRTVVLWRAWARPLVDLCDRVTREVAASPQEAGPGALQLEASLRHLMRALNDMTSKVQRHSPRLLHLLFLLLFPRLLHRHRHRHPQTHPLPSARLEPNIEVGGTPLYHTQARTHAVSTSKTCAFLTPNSRARRPLFSSITHMQRCDP